MAGRHQINNTLHLSKTLKLYSNFVSHSSHLTGARLTYPRCHCALCQQLPSEQKVQFYPLHWSLPHGEELAEVRRHPQRMQQHAAGSYRYRRTVQNSVMRASRHPDLIRIHTAPMRNLVSTHLVGFCSTIQFSSDWTSGELFPANCICTNPCQQGARMPTDASFNTAYLYGVLSFYIYSKYSHYRIG